MSGEVQEQIERKQRMTAEIRQIRSEVLDLARMIESLRWRTDDPREHVNKRQRIVVVTGDDVVFADVETKHGYSVALYRPGVDVRRYVSEDETWPGWFWVQAPSR